MTIKAGIIGCGNIAWKWDNPGSRYFNTHAKAYYSNPRIVLKACSDPKFDTAIEMAKAYPGTVPYVDYKEMLFNEDLDVVSICASTPAHYDILKYIMTHTDIKYILAEKPLTGDLARTKNIFLIAKRRKVNIAINYIRRWDETLNKLRSSIKAKNIGSLQFGRAVYYGGFKSNAIHFIDFLESIGFKLKFGGFLSRIRKDKNDFYGSLVLKTKDGRPIYFHWIDEKKYPYLELDLFYEKARVRIGDYSDAEIFEIGRSRIYSGFKDLQLKRRMPSTIGVVMKNSVSNIIRQYESKKIDYGPLEREIGFMKVFSNIEKHIRRQQ